MSHRTQITLTDEQYARLRDESARTGIGLAELVRRALAHTYGSSSPNRRIQALREGFGAWRDHDVDGERYVDSLRKGMARRMGRD